MTFVPDPRFGGLAEENAFSIPPKDAEDFKKFVEAMRAAQANKKNQAPHPIPTPPPIDPFVFASQVAVAQPKDRAWRLFKGVLFRMEDVRSVFPNKTDGGFTLRLVEDAHNFTLPFPCDIPSRWFAEHVLGVEFQDTTK